MRIIAALVYVVTIAAMSAYAGPVGFGQFNLVSDIPGLAAHTDPSLVNPWGMAFNAASPIWVSDQGTNVSTLYNGAGIKQGLVVSTPTTAGGPQGPTGILFNFGNASGEFGGDLFLFANLNGTVDGWRPALGTTANVEATGISSVYTGMAVANKAGADQLYVADFKNARIDVYDTSFHAVSNPGFVDPNLPAGYSPYNIQNINGLLYVAYATATPTGAQEGAGLGIVDIFNPDGSLNKRLVNGGGPLNAPWGFALAPSGFGPFANDLLIGNFGDGAINAFDPSTGNFIGTVSDTGGNPLLNDGLWGIAFGNGANGTNTNTLYFNAGIGDEAHGLFGAIVAVPEPGTVYLLVAGSLLCAMCARRIHRAR